MLPITPTPRPARPQKSTPRRLPEHNEGAIEAAKRSADPLNARFMAMRANRNKQKALFPNGPSLPLALPVTKLGLRQPIVKDDEQVQITTLGRVPTTSQPHSSPHPQRSATGITPQLDGPTLLATAEPLSTAARTPINGATVPSKPLRVYQSVAKRQVLERRDIYQVPRDEDNKSNRLIGEPTTSSFQYPSDEPAPASPESETLEQCLRRGIRTQRAFDECRSETSDGTHACVLEEENDEEAEGDEDDDDNQSAAGEDRNHIEDEAHSKTSSQSEPLTELELEILQLGGPARPSPTPASSPKRLRHSARSESPNYRESRTNEVDGESESEEDFGAPSPKKRRCSTRRKPVKAARSEALQTLTIRRKSKSTTKSRQRKSTAKKSKQSQPSQKPKKPRRIPVDELVTVSQRFDNVDLEEHNSPPLELSQDPISQISDGHSENDDLRVHTERPIKCRIPRRARKGIGPIDASDFRFPDPMSQRAQHYALRTPSYSDGFEGKEAEPIGRLMPMKGVIRWKVAQQKIPFRMPQLILVPEKPSSPKKTNPPPRRRKKKRQSVVVTKARPAEPAIEEQAHSIQADQQPQLDIGSQLHPQAECASVEQHDPRNDTIEQPEVGEGFNDEPQTITQIEIIPSVENHDPMHISEQPELHDEPDHYPADATSPEPSTPKRLSSDEGDTEHHPSTSPLKRKQQSKRLENELDEATKSTRGSGRLNGSRPSQAASNIASTPKKTKKQAKKDFEAMYELSMVSVKRRHLSDDEESQSEYEGGDTEDEEEGGHDEVDDDCRLSNESQLSDSDNAYEETESAEEAEDDRQGLAPEQVAEKDDNATDQDEDETRLSEEISIDDSTPDEKLEIAISLQHMAIKVLELSRLDQGSKVVPDLPIVPQEKNFLKNHQHPASVKTHKPKRHKSSAPSRWDDHFDSSWRPEVPTTNSLEIEVEDEIYDSPTQPLPQARLPSQNYNSRRRSRVASRPLPLGPSRSRSPNFQVTDRDSQGSVILGDTQNFALPVSIPETQFSDEPEEPRSQVYDIPSYFSQASQNLERPVSKHVLSRTKSTPARVHFAHAETGAGLLSPSAMFRQTISPVRSTSTQRLPTLREESASASQSLHALTRRISSSMGTQPAGSRRRMQSAVYNPPFLNPRSVEAPRA